MSKLDHISVVTNDIEATMKMYSDIFHVECDTPVCVPDQGVISGYVPLDGCGIEITQPTDPNGGIQKFIDKHGAGLHHIAYQVEDLDAAEKEYTEKGYRLIIGTANGRKSIFIHPKSTGGVLIELCPKCE